MFNQTLKHTENIYRDVGGYDMSNDELERLCRKAWEEGYNYLCIGGSKKRDQGGFCICKESKKNICRMHS